MQDGVFSDYYSLLTYYQEMLATAPYVYADKLLFSRQGLKLGEEQFKNTLNLFAIDYTTSLKSFFAFRKSSKAAESGPFAQMAVILEGELAKSAYLATFLYDSYLERKASESDDAISTYKKTWRWNQKIAYILNQQGRRLTLNEILEEVIALEPNLVSGPGDRRDLNKNLSGLLKYYTTEGKFVRLEGENDTFEYGIPEWLNNGNTMMLQVPNDIKK